MLHTLRYLDLTFTQCPFPHDSLAKQLSSENQGRELEVLETGFKTERNKVCRLLINLPTEEVDQNVILPKGECTQKFKS